MVIASANEPERESEKNFARLGGLPSLLDVWELRHALGGLDTPSAAPSGAGTMRLTFPRGSIGFANSPRAQSRRPIRGTNIHHINRPLLNSMSVKCGNRVRPNR